MILIKKRIKRHTQSPFYVRLILACVHRRAVQLTCHALLERPTLLEGLIVGIEADDVVFEATGVGADGCAGRPGDRLKGGGGRKED